VTAQLCAGGESVVLETEGGPIAALRGGEPGGPPVLLLPGYTGSKEDFAPLFAPLAQAGLAVVAIDLPGQFESPGPSDPAAYTPDELARTVHAVAGQLGGQVHLLGHSFGGLVARAAVIATPERYRSLVLMCSGPASIGGERADIIERLTPTLAASGLAGVYEATLALSRAQAGYVEPPPPLAAFLERRFVTGVPAMLQGMGRALRSEPDRVAELAAVAPPTLVLFGADDDAWAPDVQRDMAARLDAPVVVVPDAAHSPAVENPSDTARALVEFWQAQG
jgi:pimeloyl-ACP methyl ester carboxylesterase